MSLVFVVGTLGLMAYPALSRRRAAGLAPSEWAKLSALSLVAGAVLFELALVLCALPVIPVLSTKGAAGIGSQHFFPGGPVAGWVSLSVALAFGGLCLWGAWKHALIRRRLRAVASFGRPMSQERPDVVVLPTRDHVAMALPGGYGRIVLSDGVVASLTREQLSLVILHERAHLSHHHSRYLFVAAALWPAMRCLPVLRRSLAVLRLALERWADEEAAGRCENSRSDIRHALVALATWEMGMGLAAFSAVDTVMARLQALDGRGAPPSRSSRAGVYVSLAGFMALAAGPLLLFMR